jgi:hypothetical protein
LIEARPRRTTHDMSTVRDRVLIHVAGVVEPVVE